MRTIELEEAAKWDEQELQDNVLYLKDRLRFRDLDTIAQALRKARKNKLSDWVREAAAAPGPVQLLTETAEEPEDEEDDEE